MVPQRPWLSPWHHPLASHQLLPSPLAAPEYSTTPSTDARPLRAKPAQSFQLESSDPQSICLGGRKGPTTETPSPPLPVRDLPQKGASWPPAYTAVKMYADLTPAPSRPRLSTQMPPLPPRGYLTPPGRGSRAAPPQLLLRRPLPLLPQLPCIARLWGNRPGRSGCISEGILRPF